MSNARIIFARGAAVFGGRGRVCAWEGQPSHGRGRI